MANQVGEKKPNIFKRIGMSIKRSLSELAKVTWPTFGEVVKNTGIVLAVVVFFTLIIGGADAIFLMLFKLLTTGTL